MRAVEGLMYLAPACTFWLAIGVGLLEYRCRLRELLFAQLLQLLGMRRGPAVFQTRAL